MNTLDVRLIARSSLIEQLMALEGRSALNPRAERTRLEGLLYADLEAEYTKLMQQTAIDRLRGEAA